MAVVRKRINWPRKRISRYHENAWKSVCYKKVWGVTFLHRWATWALFPSTEVPKEQWCISGLLSVAVCRRCSRLYGMYCGYWVLNELGNVEYVQGRNVLGAKRPAAANW